MASAKVMQMQPSARDFGLLLSDQYTDARTVATISKHSNTSKHSKDEDNTNTTTNTLFPSQAAIRSEQAYIPLSVARNRLQQLQSEMNTIKSKHLLLIDQITDKYERMQTESRAGFESVVEQVKLRATLKLAENRATIEQLTIEMNSAKELQLAAEQQAEAAITAQQQLEATAIAPVVLEEKENEIQSLQAQLEAAKKANKRAKLMEAQQAKSQGNDNTEGTGSTAESAVSAVIGSVEPQIIIETQIKEIIKHVQDPELQNRVRELEQQINALGTENMDLQQMLAAAEEKAALILDNQSAAAVLGVSADTINDANPPLDEAQQQQFQQQRAELTVALESLNNELFSIQQQQSELAESISAIENELKPAVIDYKQRVSAFKSSTELTELETQLNISQIVDSENGELRPIQPTDYTEIQRMIELDDSLTEQRNSLGQLVAELKEKKSALDSEKVILTEMKNNLNELKSQSESDESLIEQYQAAETEFLSKRAEFQSAGQLLKSQYSSYESAAAEFKPKESELQIYFKRFNINSDQIEGKSRRFQPDEKSNFQQLILLNANRLTEREALKSLQESINTNNNQLKQYKLQRTNLESSSKSIQENIDNTQIELQNIDNNINAAAAAGSSASTVSSPPLTARSSAAAAAAAKKREIKQFIPIQPTVFTETEKIVSESVIQSPNNNSSNNHSSSGISDSALQLKFDQLTTQFKSRSEELTKLKIKLKQLESLRSSENSTQLSEIDQLKAQLRILSEGTVDEKFQALNNQLDNERAAFQSKLEQQSIVESSLNQSLNELQSELKQKTNEIDELQHQLQIAQLKISKAKSRPTTAGSNRLSAPSGGDSGSSGGISPEQLAEAVAPLEANIAELTNRIQQLETDLHNRTEELESARRAASGGVAGMQAELANVQSRLHELEAERTNLINQLEQLQSAHSALEEERNQLLAEIEQLKAAAAASAEEIEARLVNEHTARQSELESAHSAAIEQLNNQLNDIQAQLTAETAAREQLQNELTEMTTARDTLQSDKDNLLTERTDMLEKTANATAAMDGLTAVIAEKDQLIEYKEKTIAETEASRNEWQQQFEFLDVRYREEQKRRKEFQFKYEDAKGKVRVYSRVRPFTKAEIENKEKTLLRPGKNDWALELNETQRDVMGNITDKWREFAFDHVFHFGLEDTKGNGSQLEVFEETKIFAELSMQGINTCVFAYGQSGTGKTWTMAGQKPCEANNFSWDNVGLKPRMIQRVFELKAEQKLLFDYEVSCYMVEIYLNQLEDLFWKIENKKSKTKAEPPELKVRVDAKKKVSIDNVKIKSFDSSEELISYMDSAEEFRRTRKTGLNEASSRSHLVFTMIIEQTDKKTGKKVKGKLSLVDLAGSERADKTNVEGLSKSQRDAMMEEGVAINESLRMLKNVFRILGTQHLPVGKGQKPEIVQYRGNMLTELMQDSLGGSAKTLMFVNVGPAASNVSESIDSLQYGDYVKNITNEKASADEDFSELIRRMKDQLKAYEEKFGAIDAAG